MVAKLYFFIITRATVVAESRFTVCYFFCVVKMAPTDFANWGVWLYMVCMWPRCFLFDRVFRSEIYMVCMWPRCFLFDRVFRSELWNMLLASIFLLNTLTMLTIAHADRSRPTLKHDERFRNGLVCDLDNRTLMCTRSNLCYRTLMCTRSNLCYRTLMCTRSIVNKNGYNQKFPNQLYIQQKSHNVCYIQSC